MADKLSRKLAAQVWCKPTTEKKEMDVVLAEEFANTINVLINTIECAYNLLCNVNGGNITKGNTEEWVRAFERFRDNEYHVLLSGRLPNN